MSRRSERLKALSEYYTIDFEGQCAVRWTAVDRACRITGGPFTTMEAAENDCIDKLIVDLVKVANEVVRGGE
jgi:hypothetical protein